MTELNKFWSEDAEYTNLIRNSFKNFFKCPKCRLDYSVRRDLDTNKRFRPYMLPCQHTLCENCILKNLRNLECPVCFKPLSFPKTRINIKDYFELDFYVIGYLYYHNLFDEIKDTSVINDIIPKAIVPKAKQKCSECDYQEAFGKCLHCKAFFCNSCFSNVHAKSKVLRNHRLDRLTSDDQNLSICSPNKCLVHFNVINYVCITCDEELCKICRRVADHEGHEVKRIFDENQIHRDDITNMLDSLKKFGEVLSESEKHMKEFDTQIKRYMTETAAKISEHFNNLHSFLQVKHNIIMKQFKDFWEEPHDGLVNMKNHLKKSKTALTSMRSNLEYLFNNMPSDRSIEGFLKNYSAYLETLPCKAQTMKFESNPVTFAPETIDIDTTFTILIKQPTTEFALGSLYSYQFGNLDNEINYPTESDLSLNTLCKSNNSKDVKYSKKKRSPTKEFSIKYTVLKKKTSKPNEVMENLNEILSLRSGSEPYGNVTYIKSPSLFYVQLQEHKPQIKKISDAYKLTSDALDITEYQNNDIKIKIEIGKLYIIFYTTDELFYRALVMDCCPNGFYNVYLVDLGYYVEIELKYFKSLKEEHIDIPYAAICCSLYNLIPSQGSIWHKDATVLFTQLTSNEVSVVLKKYHRKQLFSEWSVDIFVTYQGNYYNVKEVMLYTGFAVELSETSTLNNTSVYARQEHCLQKRQLTDNQYVVCRICSVENPLEFYALPEELIEERDNLNKSLNETYGNEEKLKTILVGYKQMCCATQVNGIWQRGRIERMNAEGVIDVFMIDEGKSVTVKWNQIFELLKEFREKEFLFQCELLGVTTSQKDNYQWTNEALNEFKYLVQNPRVMVYINTKNDCDVYKVNLIITKGNNEIDVAAELIKSKLCDPVGEYQSILNTDNQFTFMEEHYNNRVQAKSIVSKTENKNSKRKKNFINRTPIEIVEIVNPSEFYVYVKQLLPGIVTFLRKLSQTEYERPLEEYIWQENKHCIVNAEVHVHCIQQLLNEQTDQSCKNINFHRGRIVNSEIKSGTECRIYDIYLRDYGKILRNIDSSNIYFISAADDDVSDSAQRCHLAGIQPLSDKNCWSKTATEFFMRVTTKSSELSATLHGSLDKSINSLPIILWKTSLEIEDALAPNQQNHTKLNCILVNMGYACYVKSTDKKDNLNDILGTEWIVEKISSFIDDAMQKAFKAIDKAFTPEEDFECTNNSQECGYNKTYSLEIIDLTPTDPTMPAPTLWLKPKRIHKTYFMGVATYVDYNGTIYMHQLSDRKQMQKMRLKLNKYFAKYSSEKSFRITDFGVNQACIAKYHMDNSVYRCIIKAIIDKEIKICFIDYGSEEIVDLKDILPYAPYANIQAYADTYSLLGICPKNDISYTERELDMMHNEIVGKVVTVRVPPIEFQQNKIIKLCSICDGSTDVASKLIIAGFVKPLTDEIESVQDVDTNRLTSMMEDQNEDCLMISARDVNTMSPMRTLNDDFYDSDSAPSGLLYPEDEFDDLFEKFATSLDLLDTHNGADQSKQEGNSTLLNNSPPAKKPMFKKNDYIKLKNEFERNHILDAKTAFRKTTNAENNLILEHHSKGFANMCKEEMNNSCDNLEEDLSDDVPINSKTEELVPESDISGKVSPFERFCPNLTSTMRSHISGINTFTFPKLKKSVTSFQCKIMHVVQPDVLYIVIEPQREESNPEIIGVNNNVACKLDPLKNFNRDTACLAQYTKDNHWYRATIRHYYESAQLVTVTYTDFFSHETLPITKLKELTSQMKEQPLRFYEVHVANVNKKKTIYKKDVCAKIYLKFRGQTFTAKVLKNDTENNLIYIELYDRKNNNVYEKTPIKSLLK